MKLAETKRKLKLIVAFPLDVAFTILRKAVVRLLKTRLYKTDRWSFRIRTSKREVVQMW